jgi:hypothetical protein
MDVFFIFIHAFARVCDARSVETPGSFARANRRFVTAGIGVSRSSTDARSSARGLVFHCLSLIHNRRNDDDAVSRVCGHGRASGDGWIQRVFDVRWDGRGAERALARVLRGAR